jgi:hypothetical protein
VEPAIKNRQVKSPAGGKPCQAGLVDADQTSDFLYLRARTGIPMEARIPPALDIACPCGRILFCAMSTGSSKTPLVQLRGGTSFELAVSSNCIEDNLSRIFGILTFPDFMPSKEKVKGFLNFHS